MFKHKVFFTPFWWLRRKNDEEFDDVDDFISHAVCGGVNCHCLSEGQFGNLSQMRIPFDLKVPLLRIIPKEIIGEEGKDEYAKTFITVGKRKTVLIPINRKLVK